MLQKNVDASLFQPAPGGNCVNGIVGHIVATRSGLLRLLGKEPVSAESWTSRYERGSEPITGDTDTVPFQELIDDFNASQEVLVSALAALDDHTLARKINDEPLVQKIGMLHFHEAYHVGQLGIMRRLLGMEGAIE